LGSSLQFSKIGNKIREVCSIVHVGTVALPFELNKVLYRPMSGVGAIVDNQ
jgi:hypothetical protein